MSNSKQTKPVIYLDMDGVLVDFVGGVLALFGIKKTRRSEVLKWDGIQKLISDELGCTVEEATKLMWQEIDSVGADFWADLKWLPHGKELLKACQEAGTVVLCTTPSFAPSSFAGKATWIRRNTPDVAFALTRDKHLLASQRKLLVDDRDANVDAFRAAGGRAILVPQPWNSASDRKAASAIPMVTQIAGII